LGYALGLLVLIPQLDTWLVFTAAAILALVQAMRAADLSRALPRAGLLALGVAYAFGCWRCAIHLHDRSPHWLMYALLVSWAGDIGAYYVGRAFGEHQLAERISPKKSWEGAIASVITSVLLAGGYLVYVGRAAGIPEAIGLTIVANIAGQVGDLAESSMKRGAGVKDSGALLPGHGGFLDRVDSTLFVLPVVWAYLRIWG